MRADSVDRNEISRNMSSLLFLSVGLSVLLLLGIIGLYGYMTLESMDFESQFFQPFLPNLMMGIVFLLFTLIWIRAEFGTPGITKLEKAAGRALGAVVILNVIAFLLTPAIQVFFILTAAQLVLCGIATLVFLFERHRRLGRPRID